MQADPTVRPDRRVQAADALLEQDERAVAADPAARLMALRDEGVDPGRLSGLGLLEAGRHQESTEPRVVNPGDEVVQPRASGIGDDDELQSCNRLGQDRGKEIRTTVHKRAAAPTTECHER